MLRLLSYLFIVLVVTSCYKGSSGSLIKRKYNKGFFVQHSGKAESKKVSANEARYKPSPVKETVNTECAANKPIEQVQSNTTLSLQQSLVPPPLKTNASAPAKSTSAQINKIKVVAQKKSQRQHPNGCFNDPGFNDVTGPLAVVVFCLLTMLYAAAIMSQSPGANWIVALALGALFAAITMVTGVSCM